ncbi:MAG: TonB-dependent receptor [Halioglobus sp.]
MSLPLTLFASNVTAQSYSSKSGVRHPGPLEEIVVNAQFLEQNVQDTPIAITAITGETLEARSHLALPEIAAQSPNVTLTQSGVFGGNALTAYIRGVGQTDFIPSLEPGVGVFVDEVYYASITGAVLGLLDLERVEVLRGPQGTLGGKNTIGGSIKLITKKPSAESDGFIEAGYGEFDAVRVRGATNLTLLKDSLWARVSANLMSSDGYVENLDYGCIHPDSGYPASTNKSDCVTGHEGGTDYLAGRIALLWQPSEALDINLSLNIVDEDSDPIPNVAVGFGETTAPIFDTAGLGFPFVLWDTAGNALPYSFGGQPIGSPPGCLYLATGPSCDPSNPDDIYVNYSTYEDTRTGQVVPREKTLQSEDITLTFDWLIGDNLSLNSVTAYRDVDSDWGQDSDGTPVPISQIYQFTEQEQYSQEFRLSGGSVETFDWTVGAFYNNSDALAGGRVGLGYVGLDFLYADPVETTNIAAYANGNFYIGERIEINAGLRYSEDDKEYLFQRSNPDASEIQPCIGPPGTPGNPLNCAISDINDEEVKFSDERVDYRAAISYRFNDSVMGYTSYSTGFKGGGNNPRPFYNAQVVSVEPEEMKTIEVGVKSDFWNGRARLNAAYFFNDYDGVQSQFSFCPQFGEFATPCLATLNAGDAESSGFELEFDAALTENILVDLSLATIDFEWTSVEPGANVDHNGVTPFTPELSWSIGAQYTASGNLGTLVARVDANYQDDMYSEASNTQSTFIGDYTLINGSLVYSTPDERWSIKLEGKNLTDEEYFFYRQDGISFGADFSSPALPRTWMISARRNFF